MASARKVFSLVLSWRFLMGEMLSSLLIYRSNSINSTSWAMTSSAIRLAGTAFLDLVPYLSARASPSFNVEPPHHDLKRLIVTLGAHHFVREARDLLAR
jgi:hypothetical protein